MKPKPAESTNPEASGIPIRCAYSAVVAVETLKPNPRNPNQHPDRQLELYAKLIAHQGWRRAVVVSNQSGLIVTGHGAVEAARRKGWSEVPVDYQDFATPEDETAHMLADNELQDLSELDEATVRALEAELAAKNVDLELTGILMELGAETEGKLVTISIPAPPVRTWFLIGFPTVQMPELQPLIDQVAALPGVYLRSTVNDDTSNP